MFENVDGQRTDAGVTAILIAHLGAFGSGELKKQFQFHFHLVGKIIWVETQENLSSVFANNNGADQHAHLCLCYLLFGKYHI